MTANLYRQRKRLNKTLERQRYIALMNWWRLNREWIIPLMISGATQTDPQPQEEEFSPVLDISAVDV